MCGQTADFRFYACGAQSNCQSVRGSLGVGCHGVGTV